MLLRGGFFRSRGIFLAVKSEGLGGGKSAFCFTLFQYIGMFRFFHLQYDVASLTVVYSLNPFTRGSFFR